MGIYTLSAFLGLAFFLEVPESYSWSRQAWSRIWLSVLYVFSALVAHFIWTGPFCFYFNRQWVASGSLTLRSFPIILFLLASYVVANRFLSVSGVLFILIVFAIILSFVFSIRETYLEDWTGVWRLYFPLVSLAIVLSAFAVLPFASALLSPFVFDSSFVGPQAPSH